MPASGLCSRAFSAFAPASAGEHVVATPCSVYTRVRDGPARGPSPHRPKALTAAVGRVHDGLARALPGVGKLLVLRQRAHDSEPVTVA